VTVNAVVVVDALVWLDRQRASRAIRRLGRVGQVVQVLPPRLASVAVPDDALARVSETDGVRAVFAPGQPAVLPYPSPAEALFIAAWNQRSEPHGPKERPGDTLDWDAPHFHPPDPPP
jgi:hypothetical protein